MTRPPARPIPARPRDADLRLRRGAEMDSLGQSRRQQRRVDATGLELDNGRLLGASLQILN